MELGLLSIGSVALTTMQSKSADTPPLTALASRNQRPNVVELLISNAQRSEAHYDALIHLRSESAQSIEDVQTT